MAKPVKRNLEKQLNRGPRSRFRGKKVFMFKAEQKVFDISGLKIGGQPGQFPTVMIGSIFYHGDRILTDERTGTFDRNKAEEILTVEEDVSASTGNPRIVDICASWPDAFHKCIDFVASTIGSPFALDGTTAEVRMAGIRYVQEVGLSNRVVYNSLSLEAKDAEISAIREAKIESAILLALNNTNPTIAGRLAVIPELLEKANAAGVTKTLVDTTVLDVPDPGPAGKTAYLVKEKYGLPCGCGAHNAVDMWHKRKRLEHEIYLTSSVVANIVPIVYGANFMLYGPIKNASRMYTPVAVADAYVSYSMMQEYNIRPLVNTHPIYKVFRK
jgi:tetrahydromethanopterin S-methyltransferase subunit H